MDLFHIAVDIYFKPLDEGNKPKDLDQIIVWLQDSTGFNMHTWRVGRLEEQLDSNRFGGKANQL